MNDMLVKLIWLQHNLQTETYGYDFPVMLRADIIRYLRDQHQAITVEMSEVLDEIDWKPWADGSRPAYDRDALVGELIDVLHFWLNMWIAVSGKHSAQEIADEIFTRYALKNKINRDRQVDSYDGRSTKCGGCGRALDDVAVECRRVGDQGYCAKTDSDINYIAAQITTPTDYAVLPLEPLKLVVCSECHHLLDKYGCEPPTTERWGNCMANVGSVKNIPPIKLPTES